MKKEILITLSIILGLIGFTSAQGNLQFNQVVNATYNANVYQTLITAGTLIVPVGKVLKIESCSYITNPGTIYQSSAGSNSSRAYVGDNTIYGSPSFNILYPIWLSEGTYDIKMGEYFNVSSPMRLSISAIEFNIIP